MLTLPTRRNIGIGRRARFSVSSSHPAAYPMRQIVAWVASGSKCNSPKAEPIVAAILLFVVRQRSARTPGKAILTDVPEQCPEEDIL